MTALRHFKFFLHLHRRGDPDCGGCDREPIPCAEATCAGLLHFETIADEGGSWLGRVCDRCGGACEPIALDDLAVEKSWEDKKRRGRERDERIRRAQFPTEEEQFSDVVSFVEEYFSPEGYWGDQNQSYPTLAKVELCGFPWGGEQGLFNSPFRRRLFDHVKETLRKNPGNSRLRAAGIFLYWRLSRHTPYDLEYGITDWEQDPLTGLPPEGEYRVPDYSERWELVRNEYRAWLSELVRLVKPTRCVDWAAVQWEIRNACAAGDWDMVRELFAHAEEKRFLPSVKIWALRLHFEYRVVFGNELDRKLGLAANTVPNPGCRKWREELLLDEFSPDALHWFPRIVDTSWEDDDNLFAEWIWGAFAEETPSLTRSDLLALWWLGSVPADLDSLGQAKSFYMSLLAQCCEARGKLGEAARHYKSLAKTAPGYGVKSAKLLRRIGQPKEAAELLTELLVTFPDDFSLLEELARVQLRLSDIPGAQKTIHFAGELPGVAVADDIRFLLSQRPILDTPELEQQVAQQLKAWPGFARLASDTREALKHALRTQILAHCDGTSDTFMRTAAFYFSKGVERELMEKIFKPFKCDARSKGVICPESLRQFVQTNRNPSLGQFIEFLETDPLRGFVGSRCPRLLEADCIKKLRSLRNIGNYERHKTLDSGLAEKAQPLAWEVLEIL